MKQANNGFIIVIYVLILISMILIPVSFPHVRLSLKVWCWHRFPWLCHSLHLSLSVITLGKFCRWHLMSTQSYQKQKPFDIYNPYLVLTCHWILGEVEGDIRVVQAWKTWDAACWMWSLVDRSTSELTGLFTRCWHREAHRLTARVK